MPDSPPQDSIADALNRVLEDRRASRQVADERLTRWADFQRRLDALMGRFEHLPFDTPEPVVAALAELRRLRDAGRSDELRLVEDMRALRARVHRDGITLGVVGRSRSGKSTLLRAISGLGEDVIPSRVDARDEDGAQPTTAAPSRITHTTGASRAVVRTRTWIQFQERLAVRHRLADLPDAPVTLEGFRSYAYPPPGGNEHRRFLVDAQRSLPTYEHYLDSGELVLSTLAEVVPFISYSESAGGPYLAVDSAEIEHSFPQAGRASISLVDLPGRGEVGLDITRDFLHALRSEVDVLVMLKRPSNQTSFWSQEDNGVLEDARLAAGGVQLADYCLIVLNADPTVSENFRRMTRTTTSDEARARGIHVLEADVADQSQVAQQVLAPLLDHLAKRLRSMDEAAAAHVRAHLDEIARRYGASLDALNASLEHWRLTLPADDSYEFRELVERKVHDLTARLAAVVVGYDRARAATSSDEGFEEAVTRCIRDIDEWIRAGMGAGSREAWVEQARGRFEQRPEAAREFCYSRARLHLEGLVDQIDRSLDRSVAGLRDTVASALRAELGSLVPDGPDGLVSLASLARSRQAARLEAALGQLLATRDQYGSVVLRVSRPVISRLRPHLAVESTGNVRLDTPPDGALSSGVASGFALLAEAASRVSGGVAPPPGPPPGPPPSSRVPPTRPSEAGLRLPMPTAASTFDELTVAVHACSNELEQRLLAERTALVETFHAACDRFLDLSCQAPGIETDFERLLAPARADLWPDRFGADVRRVDRTHIADLQQLVQMTSRGADPLRSTVES